jgi:hypothetical protein
MKKAFVAVLALAAAQAVAQTSAPQPVPAPPERKASDAPRQPLNLKLDQPASLYVRETQPETANGAGGSLPTLGGATTSFERPIRDMRPDSRGKYPMDVENPNR